MSYKVKMEYFEGPFDLLVYLISNAEMSIYDIEVSLILDQYLDYMTGLDELDVDVATEFMVLAATLIEIKAKMLIPGNTEEDIQGDFEDPRKELVQKIMEYKKFKNASFMVAERFSDNSQIYEKPQEDISVYLDNPEEFLRMDTTSFINAFNSFLLKKQRIEEMKKEYQRIERDRHTVSERIEYINSIFDFAKVDKLPFMKLLSSKTRYDTAVTFVSILEMVRGHQADALQEKPFGEITVKRLSLEEREERVRRERINRGEDHDKGQH